MMLKQTIFQNKLELSLTVTSIYPYPVIEHEVYMHFILFLK